MSVGEIKYKIDKEIAIISESPKGWTKELNLISWNGRSPKFDIRDWAPNRQKIGKGITLSKEEIVKLRDILNEMEL